MTEPRTHTTRELDRRTGDGIEVRLLWCRNDGRVTVAVSDTNTGEGVRASGTRRRARARGVPPPYAYAARTASVSFRAERGESALRRYARGGRRAGRAQLGLRG
jgi:hypothetical protein